jgi:hypothetical protein
MADQYIFVNGMPVLNPEYSDQSKPNSPPPPYAAKLQNSLTVVAKM